MKDSLDILRTDYVDDESISHHGVKGMRWGHRKPQVTGGAIAGAGAIQSISSTKNNRFDSREKRYTTNGKGLYRRKRLDYLPGGTVSGGSSYPGSVEGGGVSSSGKMSEKELVELHNKTVDDIRKNPYYSEIFKLAEELKKLADNRKANLGQATSATEMVFEAKADRIVEQINTKLKGIDDAYAMETSKIKNFKKDFSPSKWVLSDLSEHKTTSAALGLNRSTGRVSKGWSRPSTAPKNATGYTFRRKKAWEK